MKRFFSYDPMGNGIQFHDTAKEAEKDAEDALEQYRQDAAGSGWDENAREVCWGEIRQVAVASQVPAEEGATFDGEPITHWTHYELTDANDLTSNPVLLEVQAERHRQTEKWGDKQDDENNPLDWHETIADYNGWARRMLCMGSVAKARRRLIQIAALAVAQVEALDRRFPPKQ